MVDYSKWSKIEVSDDEDDTHPNIDTASLFRWRHQARMERMEKDKEEKDQFEQEKKRHRERWKQVERALQSEQDYELKEKMEKEFAKLKSEKEEIRKKEKDLAKKEKLTPWNVDTISKPGFEKTIINDPKPKKTETDEEKAKKTLTFVEKYEEEIKKFGMLRDYNASRDYLRDHPHLVSDETAAYLTLWCVNLEVQEKSALMERVAHQVIVMQYILELAKQLDRDPRSCVRGFFERMKTAESQYLDAFKDELTSFVDRIKRRAQSKLEAAMKEVEEEERKKRLGPGGLDPLEVMETLPQELRECFESKSVAKLQAVAAAMEKEEFEYHMKRCVDSGLWVSDAKSAGLTPASEQLEKELGSQQQGGGEEEGGAKDEEESGDQKELEGSGGYEEVD